MKVLKRIRRVAGPYPYSPGLLFAFIFVFFFSRYYPVLSNYSPGLPRIRPFFSLILLASGPATLIAGATWCFKRFRRWSSESLPLYILEIIFIIMAARLGRLVGEKTAIWQTYIPEEAFLKVPWYMIFFAVFMGMLINGFLSYAQRETVGKLSHARDLIHKLEADRRLLIRTEEEQKAQLAGFLHDRIQSELMNVAMALKSMNEPSNQADKDLVNSAIARLESVRVSDLRRVIEELTPDFKRVSLESAIKGLSLQHSPGFSTRMTCEITAADGLTDQISLGIYRIVEQLLLNTLIHADCSVVAINIRISHNQILLSFADNGRGVELDDVVDGTGTAIIDGWLLALNGKRKISSSPGTGYKVEVELPLQH
ncbi:unannotated protein [freshwater metagenome]|uniref:histidine kinase n=2 Tax=freshwater metagenome TaxID=449393 RepID=A0A6J6BCZ8_9ZZZZ